METAVSAKDDAALLALFERLALDAGRAIMAVRDAGIVVERKADTSPVTEADRAAERVILEGLRVALADVTCVSEEEVSSGYVPVVDGDVFLLVDPLDGTREFVGGKTDFTVNIALVRDGVPEVGVVFAPARGVLYSGRPGVAFEVIVSEDFAEAGRREIATRPAATPPVIVASRSHRTPETDDYIAKYEGAEIVSVGSSLKFCMLAAGEADLYPRFGRTMEWDTAAGDAVLRAAGGRTRTLDGKPLAYGKRNQADDVDFANPWFVAEGRPA